jgi:UDP-2,3-diacylglucosamine pyrophosphatase LpxH
MNSGKTIKRIFLSDIHMGDGRSVEPGQRFYPYSWFYGDRPQMLAAFFEQYCIADKSLGEVVLVGDLFDEWVCPAQFDPTDPARPMPPQGRQFMNTAAAPQNQSVIKALEALAAQNRLTYLTGNHDMLADKAVIGQILPGVIYVDSTDGHSVYHTKDGIWAEHGHWYGLFNAPYPRGSGGGLYGSMLPLGFFISRIIAQEVLKTGKTITFGEIIKEWLEHIVGKIPEAEKLAKGMDTTFQQTVDRMLMELFDTLVSNHAADQKGALLNGLDGIPGVVIWQEVKRRYGHIFSEWSSSHADNVNAFDAIRCDAESLDPAAQLIFFNHEEARIVVCGHTHKPECTSTLGDFDTRGILTDTPVSDGASPIYANTGAWINDASRCTFVETEFNPGTGNHLVRVREWTRSAEGKYVVQKVPACPDLSVSV